MAKIAIMGHWWLKWLWETLIAKGFTKRHSAMIDEVVCGRRHIMADVT